MSAEDQLLYEASHRDRQIGFAVAGGVLLLVSAIIALSGPHAKVNELTLGLITDHKRGQLDLISAVIGALADLGIAGTLVYLSRCAQARATARQAYVPVIAIIGAALSAVAGILNAIVISIKVHDFVTSGMQTYDEANRLTSGAGLLMLQIAAQLASLIVAIAFVLVSLQAMRVGLLPRVLGYVGMLAGALVLFPLIVLPVVQLYWLLAVAYLVSGRWPSGVPPAWTSGRAEAWPSSAETRARRAADAETARDRRAARRRGESPKPPSTAEADDPSPGSSGDMTSASGPARPGAARRKRKRRR